MREISEREMTIFFLRRCKELTFKEIAGYIGVTKSRIAAIQQKTSRIAYTKIKKEMVPPFTCDQLEGVRYYYDNESENSNTMIRKYVQPLDKVVALRYFYYTLIGAVQSKFLNYVSIYLANTPSELENLKRLARDMVQMSGIEDLEQLADHMEKDKPWRY